MYLLRFADKTSNEQSKDYMKISNVIWYTVEFLILLLRIFSELSMFNEIQYYVHRKTYL